MSEAVHATTEVPAIKAPAKRKAKRKAKPAAPKAEKSVVSAGEFAGITAKNCPTACAAKRCVISTVAVCHHPYKSSPNSAGPITMANRDKARKLIKHQMVETSG